MYVRLRSSKTDQEAHGQVKALPYGRDPLTCPPCAYVRWREVLHAWDTTADGGGRRAVMTVLARQAATAGGADQESGGLHCCRSTRLPVPMNPQRMLFPSVHKGGAVGVKPMTGHAVNETIKRRADQAGFTAAQTQPLGGHSCDRVSSPRPSGPALTPTPSCGRPGTAARRCSRSTPGERPTDG